MHAMLHLWYGSGMWVYAVWWGGRGVQRYSSHAEKKTMEFLWLPQKWKRLWTRERARVPSSTVPACRAWFESWQFFVYNRDASEDGVDCYSWATPATAVVAAHALPSFYHSTNHDPPPRNSPPAELGRTPIRANPLAVGCRPNLRGYRAINQRLVFLFPIYNSSKFG
jgi:hypothetical protein